MNKVSTKLIALLLLASVAFVSACKKDKDDSLAVTKENLAATYTLVSIKAKATNVPEQDVTDYLLDACQKDDEITLKTDGTYTYTDAGTACSPKGDDSGSWSLSGSTLTIDGYANGTVKTLNKGTLVVEATETNSGITYTYTTTYNRK
jgi:glutamate synthase domain-containing protein 3